MTKRKTFSKEFKLEAVRQLELGDKSPNDIAIDLGIRRNMLVNLHPNLTRYLHRRLTLTAIELISVIKLLICPEWVKD